MNGQRIEDLIKRIQASAESGCRDAALELLQAVMDLHGQALERMMNVIHEADPEGKIFDACATDDLTSGMLLLHDLHPWNLERRVRHAIEQPSVRGRAAVDLISVRDGVVKLRIDGGPAVREAVESAVAEAAPDATAIAIESAGNLPAASFVPLTRLVAR